MDERTRHLHDVLERAIERFRDERDSKAEEDARQGEEGGASDDPLLVREVDERVLEDLSSKYSNVLCPVHGTPPRFDVEGKAVREWFCCETLLSLVRELSKEDAAA